jgi:aryl-alcohol dehydrogenase-like predicted oxidoreductase
MTDLATAVLGRTGLVVTKLGFGAMELRGARDGSASAADDIAPLVRNQVLDAGINFIDTSPDYGSSERVIGEAIASRRDEYVLASKCGCPVAAPTSAGEAPPHDYTPENIRAAVERSLQRMRTDRLDVVQVHMSPSRATLEEDGAVEVLAELRDEGKIRFLGMSGILPNITDHIAMGVFDAFQIPYSALEREHEQVISDAAAAGAGTIIRGGVAKGQPDTMPNAQMFSEANRARMMQAAEFRRQRWEDAELDDLLEGRSRAEFTLRFTLTHPDLHTTIVGTKNPDHLAANVAAAGRGPLPPDVYEEAKRRLGGAPGAPARDGQ